ncbi:MAG: hypothetical protein WHU94_04485 [Thermogemmata sp.]|uniref:Uncharacterized protein n=1 Tax=Thermogemmata fonticola TaxID=2755323 RepID=A0A7V8VAR9_9BACT|nr:hypothetical protein [Thermogemmata fonticola]MBA2224610.1 hypothetical protein [Thermogemmata fonticola]GIW85364.1 MAG: hypothetical protein KatS3mg107_1024 [Gemmataceae bacterium]
MTNTPVDSTHLTRQQLEELDALLQRMLAMTQKASAENVSTNDIAPLSNSRESMNTSPVANNTLIIPHESMDIKHTSLSYDVGGLSKIEDHKMTSSKTTTASFTNELPLAEELKDNELQKCEYYDNTIILYPLIYINYIYNYICQYLGRVGSVLSSRIARYLFGILGIMLICYTMLWYAQSQQFLPWTFSIPWTLQDWCSIISVVAPQ